MPKVEVREGNAGVKLAPVMDEIREKIRQRFEDVRRRAHEFFEKRQQHGSALDDWVKAEREILGSPLAELRETGGAYQAEVALPGFAAGNVSVTATPDEIVVYAFKEDEQHREGANILWTEFGSREVYRRLETPEPIDTGKTTATLEKGILRITAPKSAPKSAPQAAEEPAAATQAAKSG